MVFTIICAFCNATPEGPTLANQDSWRCPSCGHPFGMPEGWTIEQRDDYIERAKAHHAARWDAHCLDVQAKTGRDMSGYLRRHGMPWMLHPDGTVEQRPDGTLPSKPNGLWIHVRGAIWRRPGLFEAQGGEIPGPPRWAELSDGRLAILARNPRRRIPERIIRWEELPNGDLALVQCEPPRSRKPDGPATPEDWIRAPGYPKNYDNLPPPTGARARDPRIQAVHAKYLADKAQAERLPQLRSELKTIRIGWGR